MSTATEQDDHLRELVTEILKLNPSDITHCVGTDKVKGSFSFTFTGENSRTSLDAMQRISELAARCGIQIRVGSEKA